MNENWYIIINPRAGSGRTMSEWMPAEKVLQKLKIPFESRYTQHRKHAVELANNAARNGYRKFLAVGGDGTIHELYRGVMLYCDESGTPPEEFYIGVAPIGSGNDWIKSMDVPHDPVEVIKLMHKGSFGTMDVVKMYSTNGMVSYMTNIAGTGFDAHVCERANRIKSLGWRNTLIYVRSLQYAIRHCSAIDLVVKSDGTTIFEGPCYSIAMGNGRYSGGGMRQVPAARIDDGKVDAMIVPKLPIGKILKELPQLFSGTLMSDNDLIFTQCKELEILPIDSSLSEIIEVDGEIEGKLPLTVKVSGSKINVLKGKI